MQSIADYFKARLGADIGQDDHGFSRQWDINEPGECIADCKAAIDACAAFLAHSRNAYGDYGNYGKADAPYIHPKAAAQAPIIAHCAHIVFCYIYS